MSRAETNYRIGRLMYQAMTDAAGYPNGMAYWEEMKPTEKYWWCAIGLDFLDSVESDLGIPVSRAGVDFGFEEKSRWGEGDCKALMEHIESVQETELAAFNRRVESIQSAYKEWKRDHPEEGEE